VLRENPGDRRGPENHFCWLAEGKEIDFPFSTIAIGRSKAKQGKEEEWRGGREQVCVCA